MKRLLAALLTAAALPSAALAANVQTGTFNGMTYTAQSYIIGQDSTATVAGGGDPIYLGLAPQYRGTVGLLMDEGAAGKFVCSGSLSSDRMSIITAAHCVSNGSSVVAQSVTAYFYNPVTPDVNETPVYTAGAPNVTTVGISQIQYNPLYTGQVIDDHDIAVLRLASAAPSFANGYDLYTGTNLTGLNYNVAGYGTRSDVGGSLGVTSPHNLSTGRLRQGDNRYDFRVGDSDFGGQLSSILGPASNANTWLSDFDDGTAAHDASCVLATQGFGLTASSKYCNTGRGLTEVSTAGGDSGGPQFINGKLATITSFGLTFGSSYGDIDNTLDDSFGEFNGFVPIYNNLDFLNSALAIAPEPDAWLLMFAGVGMMGLTLRSRRKASAAKTA